MQLNINVEKYILVENLIYHFYKIVIDQRNV